MILPSGSHELDLGGSARDRFLREFATRIDVEETRAEFRPEWIDPETFCRDALGHRIWRGQKEILDAVLLRPRARVAVKACHASSKTFTAAEAILYWISRFPDGIAITTGPTFDKSVKRQIWGEVHKALGGSELSFPKVLQTSIEIGPDNYAAGMSTKSATAFQGWHGKILIVVDEAPGVLEALFSAIRGARAAGDVRVLMLGNPTEIGGPYYDAFEPGSPWDTYTIHAFDTPNFDDLRPDGVRGFEIPDEEIVELLLGLPDEEVYADAGRVEPWPMLTSREWVVEQIREVYEKDPHDADWEARVCGRFPRRQKSAIIFMEWIERAGTLPLRRDPDVLLEAGIDCAGPGKDETVVYVRRSVDVVDFFATTAADPREAVAEFLQPYAEELAFVKVDVTGLGWGYARYWEDLGYPIVDVNFSEDPVGGSPAETEELKKQYGTLADQAAFEVRDLFELSKVRGLEDRETRKQVASIQWTRRKGKKVHVPKREGDRSPDRAWACILAFWEPKGTKRQTRRLRVM